ncbi:MAG: hypothetical protein AAF125_19730 [Chloroflexota bacterium]
MNDLVVLQQALAHTINADPVLCLAHAVAWLDPLHGDLEDMDMPESEHDTVRVALHILRRAFPEIYFDALQAIRQGASYQRLDHLICDAVQAQGIPLDNLEWIGWGIPLPAYGALQDDPDFYTTHPDVIPVLECFGISPQPNPYNIVIPDVTYKVADIIADDLLQQPGNHWRQVAWLIRWVTSSTNNSCVDWDEEMMSSVQPLSWDADDIAFAREIVEEADGIMADVHAGLTWISQNPTSLEVLSRNVQKIYQTKGQKNARYQLEWSCPTQRDERGTQSVA